MLIKTINHFFYFLTVTYSQWCGFARKQRSIRHMQQLDNHLLNDIGFGRGEQGDVVPVTQARIDQCNAEARERRRITRARYAYLVRRKRRLLRRRQSR